MSLKNYEKKKKEIRAIKEQDDPKENTLTDKKKVNPQQN